MDGRIDRLEVHMEHAQKSLGQLDGKVSKIEERLGKLDAGVSTLTERVAHLPSKGFIVTSSMAIVTLVTAAIILGDKLRALFGA